MRRGGCLLLAALCLALLVGCGAKDKKTVPDVILRYADNQPEGYPTTMAAEYFARLVEERTNGKVCIRVFCDGVLGDEVSVFEQIQFGGVDMCRISTGTLAQFVPEAGIFQLPYLFRDSAHMSYMAVLSAALSIRRGAHIRMTAFDRYLSPKLLKVLDIIADLAVMLLGIIMLVEGWKYCTTLGGRGTYISMPWLSRFWMYLPVPVAGVAMIVFELEAIYNHIKSFYVKEGQAA